MIVDDSLCATLLNSEVSDRSLTHSRVKLTCYPEAQQVPIWSQIVEYLDHVIGGGFIFDQGMISPQSWSQGTYSDVLLRFPNKDNSTSYHMIQIFHLLRPNWHLLSFKIVVEGFWVPMHMPIFVTMHTYLHSI